MIRKLLGMALKMGFAGQGYFAHYLDLGRELDWWYYGPVSDPNTHYDYATIDDCFKAVTCAQLCTATIFLTHLS